MRGFRFSLVLFIIAVGFIFQPAPARGSHQETVTVRPYISGEDREASTDKAYFKCSTLAFECKVQIILRKSTIANDSAGHAGNHAGDRPIGKLMNIDSGEEGHYLSFTLKGGVAYIDYLAPEVSGTYVADYSYQYPWMDSPDWIYAARTYEVQIPLKPMPANLHYRLTGQTTKHPVNHYGASALRDGLTSMSDDYFEYTGEAGTAFTLGINDMSLPWGGMFDLNGQWWVDNTSGNGHVKHRIGMSVDIDHYDQFRNKSIKEDYLDKTMKEKYSCKRLEKDIDLIHYECK